jgi:hypothetical protein
MGEEQDDMILKVLKSVYLFRTLWTVPAISCSTVVEKHIQNGHSIFSLSHDLQKNDGGGWGRQLSMW